MGEHIVLHYAPIFLLVALDDGEIIVLQQLGAMYGLFRLLIGTTFAFNDIWRHEETNTPVGAAALLGLFSIVLLVHDMIVQEPRFFAARMSNQRLFLRHFQLEGIVQELAQELLDFLCFLSWASNYVSSGSSSRKISSESSTEDT